MATMPKLLMLPVTESMAAKIAADLVREWIDQIPEAKDAAPAGATTPPAIGARWPGQGGIYAGVVRGDAGKPDYHLIVSGADAAGDVTWEKAKEHAAAMVGEAGEDYTLPLRKEQAVMYGNVPELFEKAYYWSSEEYQSHAGYAWSQGFYGGYQGDYRKGSKLRARAVRRLAI